MSLGEIIDDHESREKRLTVANADEPEPIVRMLKRMVDAETVDVREVEPDEMGPGNVVILEGEGESEFAISTIEDVGNAVLMVNSDLYITGSRSIEEVDTPDVLAGLADATFEVSEKRKMLLIEISRHVEALAIRYGNGRLHSGLQSISRIDDERGTREVYESLAETGVDVHAYGADNPPADVPAGITPHAENTEEMRNSWFVVSTDCPPDRKAALLAREVGPNEWTGFWTFEETVVDHVDRYLRSTYWD